MKFLVASSCLLAMISVASAFRLPFVTSAKPQASGPRFCHGLECPAFQTESALSHDTELRSYEKVSWVSTVVEGPSLDAAMDVGFMRLFKYITGKNADNATIDMTCPVRVTVNQPQLFAPGESNSYTISFFLSPTFTPEKPAPAPTDKKVFLENEGATDYFVKWYGGWSSQFTLQQKATELMGQLDDLGMTYDKDTLWFAGYDSPFRLLNRHNEVWVKAKTMGAQH